ncbi:hypothetical protein SAMN05444413_105106 [Roseivivax marinus]|uniref:sulfotransferase n=1 Tax=Roseivivax marinus TaxID=1379903 RepID=UPI0008BF3C84|nr:sulfotransferase [Roseivivax marinus]SEL03357.1 hypothetical protein SAMN05444413_105106 [Roseivivax marinus]
MIFNLGLPKTGTTTLARALRRAGLRVADWKIRARQTDDPDLAEAFVGRVLYEDRFASGDPLARLGGFDAITEASALAAGESLWPQTDWALLDAIRTRHPDTRFLLSARDPEKTARSMMRWHDLGTSRLPRNTVPGLPRGFGGTEAELAAWVDGHQRFAAEMFGRGRFLAFDIEDPGARDEIAAFLRIDLPWWGRANANRTGAA